MFFSRPGFHLKSRLAPPSGDFLIFPQQVFFTVKWRHGREEEWQFPAQIMPVVRDTVAHAGFKITKVTATKSVHLIQKSVFRISFGIWMLGSHLKL